MTDKASMDDKVGYDRPPKAHRFAPGQSGNEKGRPRGVRRVGAILQDVIQQKVAITESGKTRKVPAIEGMLRRLTNDALRGDPGAFKLRCRSSTATASPRTRQSNLPTCWRRIERS
jgi:hypothetical protein